MRLRLYGLLFALLAAPLLALGMPLLADDAAGVTCRAYLSVGSFEWERPLGDWVDRAGRLYGDRPFDQQKLLPRPGEQLVEFDVGELVAQWYEHPDRNQGLLLRVLSDSLSGPVDFHSREAANSAMRPELKLQWADGSRTRIAPAADTFLDCSSLSSLGARPVIKVGKSQTGLLRFDLPRQRQALRGAKLLLVSGQQFGRGALVGVFRVEPPFLRAPAPVAGGIAARYPGDAGIASAPEVLMSTGFEERNWRSVWTTIGARSRAERLEHDEERGFLPLRGAALRVDLRKGENLGLDLRYEIAKAGLPEPDSLYFRYYLRFARNWNPSLDGGKLPGLSGTYNKAGWGMRKSDGTNGWSARGGFFARPAGIAALSGLTALSTYAYHADIRDASGETWTWGQGPGALLENERWYCIEQHVRLNDPAKADGLMQVWLDGQLVLERRNLRFRTVPTLKIETVWFDVYHGGVAPAPHDMSLYIDQIVVARDYIGPMAGGLQGSR